MTFVSWIGPEGASADGPRASGDVATRGRRNGLRGRRFDEDCALRGTRRMRAGLRVDLEEGKVVLRRDDGTLIRVVLCDTERGEWLPDRRALLGTAFLATRWAAGLTGSLKRVIGRGLGVAWKSQSERSRRA